MLININWVRIFTEREFIFRGAINKNTDSFPTYCDVLVHGRDISSVKNKKQKTSVSRKVKIKTRPGNRCHLPKYLLMILKIHPEKKMITLLHCIHCKKRLNYHFLISPYLIKMQILRENKIGFRSSF